MPDVVYRVAGRHKVTQQRFLNDFCDLKTVQTQVKELNANAEAQVEYYIDAILLDELPDDQLSYLLDRTLITSAQFDRAKASRSKASSEVNS